MKIPLVDLKAQYESIKGEIRESLDRVLESGQYVLGEEVEAFEREFAEFCGVPHAVALNSCTSALHLALIACGVGPGDEVITAPNTFIATCHAIAYTGACPVFVDVEPDSRNIDPSKLVFRFTFTECPQNWGPSSRSPNGTSCRSSRTLPMRTARSIRGCGSGASGVWAASVFIRARISALTARAGCW